MKINKKLSIAALALFMSVASYAPVNAQDVSAENTAVTARAAAAGVWEVSNGEWTYVIDGVEQTGWIVAGGAWYYLDDNGVMQTGWLELDGTWYYLNQTGSMATGWTVVNGNWYFLNKSGEMQTGWTVVDGSWYFLDENGAMATGWLELDGTWYYLNANGSMATNWVSVDGSWFYLKADGSMATEWLNLGGTWYYLDLAGRMLTNTTVGNWEIDANGVATEIAEDRRETLAAAIAAANELEATDYTNWNKFSPVLKAVTKVSKDKNSTDAQIESAIEDLAKATAELEAKSVTKLDLYKLVEKYKNLDEDKYTVESWAIYADALANAEAVLENDKALASEVKKATKDYEKASTDLKLIKTGIHALSEAISEAKKTLLNGSYTETSKIALERAITDGELVVKDTKATLEEYDAAREAIEKAVKALVGTPAVSKAVLYEAIEKAENKENFKQADYTAGSWSAFAKAIKEGKAVIADDKATEKEVKEAIANLTIAEKGDGKKLEGLVSIKDLTAAYDLAGKDAAYGEDAYTSDSWTAFNKAFVAAKEVLDNGIATNLQVSEALTNLKAAVLVKVEDNSALVSAIKEIELKKADYTTASWAKFETSGLAAAKLVRDNKDSSAAEISTAATKLATAITTELKVKATAADLLELEETIKEANEIIKKGNADGTYDATKFAALPDEILKAKAAQPLEGEDAEQSTVQTAKSTLASFIDGLKTP